MKKKRTQDEILEEILAYIERFSKYRQSRDVSSYPTLAQMISRARKLESESDEAGIRNRFVGEELSELLQDPFVKKFITGDLYENILLVSGMIWDIKNIGPEQAVDDGLVARTCALILDYQTRNFVYIISQPEEFRIGVAKDFLAYARDRYTRRLEILKSLQNDPILVEDLKLTDSVLAERIDFESKLLAYLQYIKAGELKVLKIFCAFPILTILRLQGESPSRSYKFIHNLLLFAEVPKYGNIAYEKEEIERIEKWDREAVKWFKSL